MRRMILSAVAGMLMAAGAGAQEVQVPDPAIEGTIRSQVEAFLADDFAQAFGFAGPGIRDMFRTPENFGAMVRNGYPMVWRPSDLRFGALREIDGVLWQQVIVRDAEGRTHVLDYRMGRYGSDWRIDAVQMLPAPDLSA